MTLEVLHQPNEAAGRCEAVRSSGRTLGFVPTMGALHAGHLELVQRAVAENDFACVSVFVNPLQFDDPRDLERYPRDLEADASLLAEAGCDLLFTGTLAGFFPEAELGPDGAPRIDLRDPGPAAVGLEGEHRPGHFAGVATIVARLFECVRPSRAYFGEKDFQQTLVVRHLAREMRGSRAEDPRVVVCPTSRTPDGLARSSRNVRLSPGGRERALTLSAALFAARERWRAGERDQARLEAVLRAELERPGVEPEYAAVRDPDRFHLVAAGELDRGRGLVAARVEGVRLIDTLALDDAENAS